ncbi:hypothetical protein BJY52DRAFT_1331855 [Lactarius psammicola]|nr:hypothetical protein BJY52DRAFT_1331855 [Lactarius psammicola]
MLDAQRLLPLLDLLLIRLVFAYVAVPACFHLAGWGQDANSHVRISAVLSCTRGVFHRVTSTRVLDVVKGPT